MQLEGRWQEGAFGAACVLLILAGGCAQTVSEAPPDDEPPGVAALVDEAERMRASGDYSAAIRSYEKAREQTPWNEALTRALAESYAERAAQAHDERKLVQAEADLRSSLELRPDHPQVTGNLARVLLDRAALDLDPGRAAERRAEAEQLLPGSSSAVPQIDAGLERRLDLAFELLERGQLDAGIERLEALRASHPEQPQPTRLLGQALVRQAAALEAAGNHVASAEALDRAVEAYAALPGCAAPDWTGCALDEARVAHHNRIVAWLNASRPADARRALEDAERIGLDFPELSAYLGRGRGGAP
jgi:tetratricopeptide (TPR) repeat protein